MTNLTSEVFQPEKSSVLQSKWGHSTPGLLPSAWSETFKCSIERGWGVTERRPSYGPTQQTALGRTQVLTQIYWAPLTKAIMKYSHKLGSVTRACKTETGGSLQV